jgi:hypothetical protein
MWMSARHDCRWCHGQGLLAPSPGCEKPIQFAFQQLECLFAAQHQRFHSVPTQVESVGVAEYKEWSIAARAESSMSSGALAAHFSSNAR